MPLTFTYDVPEDSEVSICLFDAAGMVKRILTEDGNGDGQCLTAL